MRRIAVIAAFLLLAACGGDKTATDDTARQATAAEARHWRSAWCEVEPGATRAELERAMGKPTETHPDQETWDGFGLHLTAFFDPDGRAYQLDNNGEPVGCAESRRTGG